MAEDKTIGSAFFKLYSAVGDDNVRRRLETQFQILERKISSVNRLLIENPNIAEDKKAFIDFHEEVLDDEFRSEFGFTETIVVYLYRFRRQEGQEFDRVFVPKDWQTEKKIYMENAINDLRRYYLFGEQPSRPHLFLWITDRVHGRERNSEFDSYTWFIDPADMSSSDEAARTIPASAVSTQYPAVLEDEMLIVTPLYQKTGEFLVTVNTYVHRPTSLFNEINQASLKTLLRRWYVTAHEAVAECFLSVAHSLRLHEKTLDYETLQRISIISYLLSHPSVKLFTTPLKNAADDLRNLQLTSSNAADVPVNPQVDFSDVVRRQEQFGAIIDNIRLIADLWEGNLVVLEEFGAVEDDGSYSIECQQIGYEQWKKIGKSMSEAAQVLFLNHVNDLYDDPDYKDLVIPILTQRSLGFSDFFRLSISVERMPVSFGHPKLITLHLISFLENAIEAGNFIRAAEAHRKYGEVDVESKNLISFTCFPEENYGVIEIENDCPVTREEEENLLELAEHIKSFSEVGVPITELQSSLQDRRFTTKSGTGLGWAIILAADYVSRLVVVKDGKELLPERRGRLSIDIIRNGQGSAVGVKAQMRLPLPDATDTSQKVSVKSKRIKR